MGKKKMRKNDGEDTYAGEKMRTNVTLFSTTQPHANYTSRELYFI